ncbi:hypothetical protein [Halorubrum sp. T3]|uniref:hypothetical protein n=1 Tax=Halorubrum sp. T3 TaxID=1194088 RepID=UPI0012BB0468|nr:hypothetical protein [Halorubrum sp. T3]
MGGILIIFQIMFEIVSEVTIGPTIQPVTDQPTSGFPEWLKIAATVVGSGFGAYILRQWFERVKLRRALKSEIRRMEGLEVCANSMSDRKKPSASVDIAPKEVPQEGSIPTRVYENNLQRLGLLSPESINKIVEFYSDVLRYKSTISRIRKGEDVPEPDQNALYEDINDVEETRQNLFGKDWLED